MLCFTQARTLSSGKRWRTILLTGRQQRRPHAEVHDGDVVRTVGTRRPGVLELEDGDSRDPLDEPDAGLVELLDPRDLVDRVFGPAAEGLDHAEPRPFGGSARGAGRASSQLMWSIGCQAR